MEGNHADQRDEETIMTTKTSNVAAGQKTWIVVVASTGRPKMTLRAAQAWAQSRNGLVGETIYICRSTV